MTRRMPFGKYGGLRLVDVPRQYLRWLRRQPWLGAWLVGEIDAVLADKAAGDHGGQVLLSGLPVSESLCQRHGLLATSPECRLVLMPDGLLGDDDVPDAAATCNGEQAQLAVAGLALEELQHRPGVGACRPLASGHGTAPLMTARTRARP
jgi:uncharacterized protein (DUF3820 family)